MASIKMVCVLLGFAILYTPAIFANENGEACHNASNAGRFVRDGWDGDWLAHPNNRRCNSTELTEKGRPVITTIPDPATIKRCAARLVAGNVNWVNNRQCWYAPNQRGGRSAVQLWVGLKCASLSQIRRACGVDSDRDAYINYGFGDRYRVYDPDEPTGSYLGGRCQDDVEEVCPTRTYDE